MKKSLIFFILILFIIGSSLLINIDVGNKSDVKMVKVGKSNIIMQDTDDFSVLFIKNENIYYMKSRYNNNLDLSDISVYKYNTLTKSHKLIGEILDFYFSTNDFILLEDVFLMPITVFNKKNNTYLNKIIEINYNNYELNTLKQWISNPPVTYLENYNNELLIFEPQVSESKPGNVNYLLTKHNMDTSKERILSINKYDSESKTGEVISSFLFDGEKIFTYQIKIENNNNNYFIKEYDLDGNVSNEYILNINNFLEINEINERDSVYKLYKHGNYFILNTLNSRVCIYKLINKELIEIKTPQCFLDFSQGCNYIEFFDGKSNLCFFQSLNDKNIIYLFDTTNGDFKEYNFNLDKECIQSVNRDKDGNILFKVFKNNKYTLYYIDYKKIG